MLDFNQLKSSLERGLKVSKCPKCGEITFQEVEKTIVITIKKGKPWTVSVFVTRECSNCGRRETGPEKY